MFTHKKSFSVILYIIFLTYTKDLLSTHTYISGNAFRNIADHIFDQHNTIDPQNIKPGDIIFLDGNYISDYYGDFIYKFWHELYPKITNRFILVSHNSDVSVPTEPRNYGDVSSFLEEEKLIAWFTTNPSCIHKKLFPIPIGIANNTWNNGKEKTFDTVIQKKDSYKKNQLLGLNIRLNTYPDERTHVYNLFINQNLCTNILSENHEFYLTAMSESEFILSPRGNGLDCYRTWEALLVNSIPIVRSSPLDTIYTDLPVLIINEWEEITEDFLKEALKRLKNKPQNTSKIYFDYWKNLIYKAKENNIQKD